MRRRWRRRRRQRGRRPVAKKHCVFQGFCTWQYCLRLRFQALCRSVLSRKLSLGIPCLIPVTVPQTRRNVSQAPKSSTPGIPHPVRSCSYEAGVLVFPGLWGKDTKMKPVFKNDVRNGKDVVALRMPYALPVQPYKAGDEVWSAEKAEKVRCR